MDSKEKSMKVKMLQEVLAKEFGITTHSELMSAIQNMTLVDISIFVLKPEKEVILCPKLTKT